MDPVNELATRLNLPAETVQEVYGFGFAAGKTASISGVKAKAQDIQLSARLYEEAYRNGRSMSAQLESMDPSEEYHDGLDAFERQLKIAGIRTRSIPRAGLWADTVDKFYNSDKPGAEALLPEFMSRTWRKASAQDGEERFYASSNPVSAVLEPPFLNRQVRAKQLAPAIPLSELVAITTPIDAGIYKAFYLTDSAANRTMVRVSEGAEFPTVTLTGGDHTISVKKYGIRLQASYESIRRMRIDRFALHISKIAVQSEVDKVSTGIDVLLNGDGNTSPAATTPTNSALVATLDTSASLLNLTLKGWLAWLQLWTNPYRCTTVIGTAATALQVLMMNFGTANSTFLEYNGRVGIGQVEPINASFGNIRLGWDSGVTANYLLGFDNRFALEMVQEIGTTLTETNKIISHQMDEIVMSESLGFCVIDPVGNRTLNTNG